MGHYRVVIEAVGSHGCQRDKGDGETVVGCDSPRCPDCTAREYVRRLKRMGENVSVAEIHHWPSTFAGQDKYSDPANTVVDDLLAGKRTNSFPGYKK